MINEIVLSFDFFKTVDMNNEMPIVSLDKIQELLGGSLLGKKILVLGVSYREKRPHSSINAMVTAL